MSKRIENDIFLGWTLLLSGIIIFIIGIINTTRYDFFYLSEMLIGMCFILLSYKIKENKKSQEKKNEKNR